MKEGVQASYHVTPLAAGYGADRGGELRKAIWTTYLSDRIFYRQSGSRSRSQMPRREQNMRIPAFPNWYLLMEGEQ